jgi:hypothetical protein
MAKHADRHGRGVRGRLAQPNPWTGVPVPLTSHPGRAEFFTRCVADAVAQVQEHCPRALQGVDVGIEDVPTVQPAWAPDRVPLAAAVSGVAGRAGQIVVFRRPLERRAATRKGLRILVYRTLVEQLSGLTGIPVDEIDPGGHRDDEAD